MAIFLFRDKKSMNSDVAGTFHLALMQKVKQMILNKSEIQ